jgi:elongator complex protein 3
LAELCQSTGDAGTASRFIETAETYRKAAENAWDGDWFIRGYYDDGSPLGSCVSDECRIDSIAQSFAAFAGCSDIEKVKILSQRYGASEGTEVFISAEDPENTVLLGYVRMRVPSVKAHRPEITETSSAIVRELHVYGQLVPVGKHTVGAWQHRGYGKELLAEAERIARDEFRVKKLLVISALGTRRYYMRFSYERDGVYVSKRFQ